MKKPDFYGVGPKIGRIVLPWFALTILLTVLFPSVFRFGPSVAPILLIAGGILLVTGLVLYGLTVKLLLRGLKEAKLVTTGTYRYCQNPLYAVLLLMVIPGVGLMMNSWLILTTIITGYLVFKRCIAGEYKDMTEIFGEEYLKYKEKTPEFFPFFR